MYAIIETGGKQYRVEEGSKIVVEKLAAQAGSDVTLDKVLMVGGADCKVGAPYLAGAAVTAEVVEQGRGPKVMVFKRRRRKDSKTLRGHRQDCTTIRVKSINSEAGLSRRPVRFSAGFRKRSFGLRAGVGADWQGVSMIQRSGGYHGS